MYRGVDGSSVRMVGVEATGGRELIVLVHGTGSSAPAAEGLPKLWWETTSEFAQALMGRLDAERFELAPPFMWSGANSETVRRTAGAALERQLRDWDAAGRKYHLVGHSHGGSVIWHALVRSRRSAKPLDGLVSWTTVGTPYLEFRPDLLSLWPGAPLAVAAIAVWFLWNDNPEIVNSVVGAWTFGDQRWLLGLLGAVLAMLALLALWAAWSIVGLLPGMLGQVRRQRAERRARRDYAARSLVLFHSEDEPINGIAISLRPPGEIFPRPAIDPRHPIWQKTLIAGRRAIANLYAPTLDQLVWEVVVKRVQGDDLARDRMVAVAPRPAKFTPAATGFTDIEGGPYATAADLGAGSIARNARQLLFDLATGKVTQISAQQLGRIIDWSGIIHTSYFGFELTQQRIADWIARTAVPVTGSQAPIVPQTSRYRPWLMTAALAVVTAGLAGGLWAIATLMTTNLIAPYSKQGFVERLAAQFSDPLLAAVENSDLPGQLLLKLKTAEQFGLEAVVASPGEVLASLPNADSRYRSAAVYADSVATKSLGGLEDVDSFIADFLAALKEVNTTKLKFEGSLLGLYALDVVTQRYLTDSTKEEYTARFQAGLASLQTDPLFAGRTIDIERAIMIANRLGRDDLVAPFVAKLDPDYSCDQVRTMALALVDAGRPADAGTLVNNCTVPAMAAAALRLVGDRREADPARDLRILLESLRNDDATVPSTAVVNGDSAQGPGPAGEIAAVRALMLDIAVAQDRQDFDAAAARLKQFTPPPWSASAGLLLSNATSWIALEAGFRDETSDAASEMEDMMMQDYSDVVLKKARLPEATIAQTDTVISSSMRTLSAMSDHRLSRLAMESLARNWAVLAEQSEPQLRAAVLTHAGIAYLALSTNQELAPGRVSELFSGALDALPVLRDDRAGYAVAIAEKLADYGEDPALLDRAITAATNEALKAQDFQQRAQYLGRIATLEIGRQNYPAGLRLIDTAGVPQERFRSLVLLNGKLFSGMASEDTSEVRWGEGLAQVATTWLNDPQASELN